MRTFILSLALALFLAPAAKAQISMEGGVTLANLAIKAKGDQVKTKFRTMAMIGLVGEIAMSDHVYFEPWLFYKGDGCNIVLTDGSTAPVSFNTTTAALVIQYQSGTKCSSRAFFGAGPYLSFINSTSYYETDYLKTKDFGLTANAGYRVGKHWFLRLSYWMGMTNLVIGGDDKNFIKTSNIGITGGFKMGGCRPHHIGSSRTSDNHHWRGLRNMGHYRKVRNYRHWLNY